MLTIGDVARMGAMPPIPRRQNHIKERKQKGGIKSFILSVRLSRENVMAVQGRLSPNNQGAIPPTYPFSPPFPFPLSPTFSSSTLL